MRTVTYAGRQYPAEEIARGAAFELYLDVPEPGALPNPRPGARHPFRLFVHSSEVLGSASFDSQLSAPLSRNVSWSQVQLLSQTPGADLAAIRSSALIRPGTRMFKPLSPARAAAYLRGELPHGFCYREHDLAHLRTPASLRFLGVDGDSSGAGEPEVVYALRWRAISPADYQVPDLPGVMELPPHERVGPPLLGTGFAPSSQHLIPEFVTRDLASLPLPAFTELLAFLPDGTEVTLFHYLPEQRGWARMAGPQWRRLLSPIGADQEFFPGVEVFSKLVGLYQGQEYEAVADPPGEYRVLSRTRAGRWPVETLARRDARVRWRGADCLIAGADGDWLRLRLITPEQAAIARRGARCAERGVYEVWAPAAELANAREHETAYQLT